MNVSNFSLSEWVDYIQTLHFREIDLTLDRVRDVYNIMYPEGVSFKVISIAGTNGKGSTAELLSSIFHQAGYKVAKYTSPHLVKFNERYRINQADVNDRDLILAFNRIENVRGDINLTFFEFGTLIAIELFETSGVDVAILEVGLGGRLDAVNIMDSLVSVVTSISIDHSDWLGDTVEEIGAEKIGIARSGLPCVIGVAKPPNSVLDFCEQNDVQLRLIGSDFANEISEDGNTWHWNSNDIRLENLPLPYGQSGVQISNASLALDVIHLLNEFVINEEQIVNGIRNARLSARCELISENPAVILDVSHNVKSIQSLSEYLKSLKIKGRVLAVCGMLVDKEISRSLMYLIDIVDEWYCATINHERGSGADEIAAKIREVSLVSNSDLDIKKVFQYANAETAYSMALDNAKEEDCVLVFGSFYIVGDIIEKINNSDKQH